MANPEHFERLIKGGVEEWNKFRRTSPSIQPDLSGADLSGYDFTGLDLSQANLEGADLSDAYLFHANFTEANLSGANLTEADVLEANLIKANLSNATMIRIDLSGTGLIACNLEGANLRGSHPHPGFAAMGKPYSGQSGQSQAPVNRFTGGKTHPSQSSRCLPSRYIPDRRKFTEKPISQGATHVSIDLLAKAKTLYQTRLDSGSQRNPSENPSPPFRKPIDLKNSLNAYLISPMLILE